MSGARRQHEGDRPHGVSCPGCYAAHVCNECGQRTTMMQGRCTNGRCVECCRRVCRHQVSGSGRLDFLIGCLIAALLAFAIVLGGTVAP